jgi:hypothetical protein
VHLPADTTTRSHIEQREQLQEIVSEQRTSYDEDDMPELTFDVIDAYDPSTPNDYLEWCEVSERKRSVIP